MFISEIERQKYLEGLSRVIEDYINKEHEGKMPTAKHNVDVGFEFNISSEENCTSIIETYSIEISIKNRYDLPN